MRAYQYILALSPLTLIFSAYSEPSRSLGTDVTTEQAMAVANELVTRAILTVAPVGAVVSQVAVKGSYTLNYRNYLEKLDLNEIYLKISTMTISGAHLKVSVSASFPNGNCNNPTVTYKVASGSSGILDVAIKKYIAEQSAQFVRDNLVQNTVLSRYCF